MKARTALTAPADQKRPSEKTFRRTGAFSDGLFPVPDTVESPPAEAVESDKQRKRFPFRQRPSQ